MVKVYYTVYVTCSDEVVLKQPCARSTLRCCAVGARVELEELAMKALVYKIADGHTIDDLTEEVCCGAWVTSLNLRGTSPAMHLPSIPAMQTGCLQCTYQYTCKASSRCTQDLQRKCRTSRLQKRAGE